MHILVQCIGDIHVAFLLCILYSMLYSTTINHSGWSNNENSVQINNTLFVTLLLLLPLLLVVMYDFDGTYVQGNNNSGIYSWYYTVWCCPVGTGNIVSTFRSGVIPPLKDNHYKIIHSSCLFIYSSVDCWLLCVWYI